MNWDEMLRFAVLRLGLSPDAFWRLSLVEWRMLTASAEADAPLSRAGFERLAKTYPDSLSSLPPT